MQFNREKHHMIDILFTLALFGIFTVSSLVVVTIGGNVYKTIARQMDENFSTRTSLAYVSEKIRQNDTEGAVSIGSIEGEPALVLEQDYDGEPYRTYIYQSDGYLKELFTHAGNEVKLTDGKNILEITSFSIRERGSGLYEIITVNANQSETSLLIKPHCKGAEHE